MLPRDNITLAANGRKFSAFATPASDRSVDRIVFLLHGFPDDNTTFDGVWDSLQTAFPDTRLIAPLMRGYEPSSQGLETDYRLQDMASDVVEWAGSLRSMYGAQTPIHLIGHDWGALIAFQTANMEPDLIDSIACLAIPYLANISFLTELPFKCPIQVWFSSYQLTMQFPWLVHYKMAQDKDGGYPYIYGLWKYWSPMWDISKEQHQIDHVYKTLSQPGVIDASTAYYRCLRRSLRANSRKPHWAVNFSKVPCLLIGGESDGCMHKSLYDIERNKLYDQPNVEIIKIPTIGHFMQREDPQTIAGLLVSWLRKR